MIMVTGFLRTVTTGRGGAGRVKQRSEQWRPEFLLDSPVAMQKAARGTARGGDSIAGQQTIGAICRPKKSRGTGQPRTQSGHGRRASAITFGRAAPTMTRPTCWVDVSPLRAYITAASLRPQLRAFQGF